MLIINNPAKGKDKEFSNKGLYVLFKGLNNFITLNEYNILI